MNTLIVGQGTVEDHGVGTIVVPQLSDYASLRADGERTFWRD